MQHEGWSESTGLAWKNMNPGNLKFMHQEGATEGANGFAVFTNFYDGKQALNNDLDAKILSGLNTIEDIIHIYSPASDGNNTIAYIDSVIQFFADRNIIITQDTPIDQFIDEFEKPIVLIAVNQIFRPLDWASTQASIVQLAGYMTGYAFAAYYSNVDLSKDIVQVTQSIPPSTFSGVSANASAQAIAPYNHGEVLNVLLYSGTIMQGSPEPFGGCEYQNLTEPKAPVSSVASVMYNGPVFRDPTARLFFHELIHALFDLLDISDTLHEYLLSHGGYQENEAVDLLAVFNGAQLNSPQAIATLKTKAESLK